MRHLSKVNRVYMKSYSFRFSPEVVAALYNCGIEAVVTNASTYVYFDTYSQIKLITKLLMASERVFGTCEDVDFDKTTEIDLSKVA